MDLLERLVKGHNKDKEKKNMGKKKPYEETDAAKEGDAKDKLCPPGSKKMKFELAGDARRAGVAALFNPAPKE